MGKVFRTRQAEEDYIRIFEFCYQRFGLETALETIRQIEVIEHSLAENPSFGKLDPKYHSTRFRYAFTKNRQKIFFERLGDDVVIVMAGGDMQNWKEILVEMEPFLDQQIATAKKRLGPE